MERLRLNVSGMSCGHCVSTVKGALAALDGVNVHDVSVGAVTVEYDPAVVTPERIAQAVTDEGYATSLAGRSR